MIWTSLDACLFVYGIKKTGELMYRSSRNIKHLQVEKPVLNKGFVFVGMYYFHQNWLNVLPEIE